MTPRCPYCSGKARWIMISYAAGLDKPENVYRCLGGCGKVFDEEKARKVIPLK